MLYRKKYFWSYNCTKKVGNVRYSVFSLKLGNASKYRHRVTPMPINWAPIFSNSVEGRTPFYRYRMKRNRQRVSSLIGPINKGHQKNLAAQITRHKSKSKSVNVVFYNLIFLINVSCLNRNLTSQFRTFVCISYDRVWPENIKFVYQNGHEKKQQVIQQRWRASFEWKTAQCTLQVYDLKMIILK